MMAAKQKLCPSPNGGKKPPETRCSQEHPEPSSLLRSPVAWKAEQLWLSRAMQRAAWGPGASVLLLGALASCTSAKYSTSLSVSKGCPTHLCPDHNIPREGRGRAGCCCFDGKQNFQPPKHEMVQQVWERPWNASHWTGKIEEKLFREVVQAPKRNCWCSLQRER